MMYSFKNLVLANAFLASLVSATPTPELEKKSFTYKVKRASGAMTFDEATRSLLATYAKYNFPIPQAAANYATKRKDKRAGTLGGTDPATAEVYDKAYVGPVTIGGTQR